MMSRDAPWAVTANGLRVVRLPVSRDQSGLRVLFEQIFSSLESWGADVFVSLESRLPLSPLWSRRYVVVLHDISPLQIAAGIIYRERDSRVRLFYDCCVTRRAISLADKIVTDSDSVAREVQEFLGVPSSRLITIPCGVNHSEFKRVEDSDQIRRFRERYKLPARFSLFVGYPSRNKNIALVARAYALAGWRAGFLHPVVVTSSFGRSGLETPIRTLIEEGTRKGMFVPIGRVSDEDLPALYTAAWVLICPSHHEGFGLPPLEAMACGTPVIVSNCTTFPEVVADAGLLVDPRDPEALLRALEQVNDEGVHNELVRRGLDRAKSFSWERTATQLAEVVMEN
jgi:glycosyltransferase involved in cell wall biosynthesis